MNEILHITDADFTEVVNSETPVFVDFWATWCGPCKMVAPVLERLAGKYDGKAVIAKVDIDENPDLAQRFNIMSIPTLVVMKHGKIANQIIGARPKAQILAML